LIPSFQPAGTGRIAEGVRRPSKTFRTQHTGLPTTPRVAAARRPAVGINPGSPTGRGKRRGG
jgi:hypothetical protein